MAEFKNSSNFISAELHQQILPDYEDLITSLEITSNISPIFSKSSSFSRVSVKPVWLSNNLSVAVPSVNFHGFLIDWAKPVYIKFTI